MRSRSPCLRSNKIGAIPSSIPSPSLAVVSCVLCTLSTTSTQRLTHRITSAQRVSQHHGYSNGYLQGGAEQQQSDCWESAFSRCKWADGEGLLKWWVHCRMLLKIAELTLCTRLPPRQQHGHGERTEEDPHNGQPFDLPRAVRKDLPLAAEQSLW